MDIEATMQFILNQQAQSSSKLAQIDSVLHRTSEILGTMAERQRRTEQTIVEVGQTMLDIASAQERTNEILATLAERQVATEEVLGRLAESQVATEEALSRLAESQRTLAEKQGTTEENLNVLLLTVERHISRHK